MNEQQKEQLAELEAKSRIINEFAVNIGKQKVQVHKEIAALEASIAEEAKLELVNLDYGFVKGFGGGGRLYIRTKDHRLTIWEGDDGWHSSESYIGCLASVDIIGNLKDDLTALQENVTEFEIGRFKAYTAHDGSLCFGDKESGDYCGIELEDIPHAILKLRQMHATQVRNAKK